MKWKKQVASLCLMLAMTVGMSAVSYAQFPFHLMIGCVVAEALTLGKSDRVKQRGRTVAADMCLRQLVSLSSYIFDK